LGIRVAKRSKSSEVESPGKDPGLSRREDFLVKKDHMEIKTSKRVREKGWWEEVGVVDLVTADGGPSLAEGGTNRNTKSWKQTPRVRVMMKGEG